MQASCVVTFPLLRSYHMIRLCVGRIAEFSPEVGLSLCRKCFEKASQFFRPQLTEFAFPSLHSFRSQFPRHPARTKFSPVTPIWVRGVRGDIALNSGIFTEREKLVNALRSMIAFETLYGRNVSRIMCKPHAMGDPISDSKS